MSRLNAITAAERRLLSFFTSPATEARINTGTPMRYALHCIPVALHAKNSTNATPQVMSHGLATQLSLLSTPSQEEEWCHEPVYSSPSTPMSGRAVSP
jgi:hypothetical protein